MAVDTLELVETFSLLPEQGSATMRLLSLLDDPDGEARDIVPVLEADPAMTARLLTLANSAFFGVRTKATNAWAASMVVGFNVVRALVAAGSLGVHASATNVPNGFYDHAIASAAGAGVIARRVGARSSDAFSAALLHDIGTMLLQQTHPEQWTEVTSGPDGSGPSTLAAERRVFGAGHDEVGAAVLDYLHFPQSLADAVLQHNWVPTPAMPKLSLIILAGVALAEHQGHPGPSQPVASLSDALVALDQPSEVDDELLLSFDEEMTVLATILA
jgi:putative nucleotidyltransferase with HDIG domain